MSLRHWDEVSPKRASATFSSVSFGTFLGGASSALRPVFSDASTIDLTFAMMPLSRLPRIGSTVSSAVADAFNV